MPRLGFWYSLNATFYNLFTVLTNKIFLAYPKEDTKNVFTKFKQSLHIPIKYWLFFTAKYSTHVSININCLCSGGLKERWYDFWLFSDHFL